MLSSQIIEVNGTFVGAAVPLPFSTGLRFVAADPRVEELDGSVWPTIGDIRRLTSQLFTTGKLSSPRF